MAWSKGKPWRVVKSLDRLNAQIRSAYPRAVPPATPASSWGSIADDAHSASSDHYPHFYPALGSTAVVCARDFPHAPQLGLDAHALAERLRQARDPRVGYIISNRRITGPAHGWRWDEYDGDDPHDTHTHVSTVHTAAADDGRDWQQIGLPAGEDDDVDFTDKFDLKGRAGVFGRSLDDGLTDLAALRGYLVGDTRLPSASAPPATSPVARVAALPDEVAALRKAVADLAARPAVPLTEADRADIAARVLSGVLDALSARLAQ